MSSWEDWIGERLAAGVLGLVLGVFVALGLAVWWFVEVEVLWILIGVPLACGVLGLLFGEPMVTFLKQWLGLPD